VERVLTACVAPVPAPPGGGGAPQEGAGGGAAGGGNGAAGSGAATASLLETTRGGLDEGRGGTTAGAAVPSVDGSGPGVGGSGSSSGGGDALPPPNPYVASDSQGGSADYMDFVKFRGMVSRKAGAYFKPRTFLRFPRDIRARIPSRVFFKQVYESVTLQKTRLTLQ